ncbi:hypothetical protein [Thalassomonas sp. M1454]|uniref:hypothetical protein n=1 Tax=Thalassomonas sp. M1454 TaxID=2594477 RepID=UPI00117E4461|nr:hypothetical protein [Thalassomonas sp. M1454]TRX57206.1 hypothetical protein FNN08_06820 [Thalassomonas sp. M1454]
MTNKNTKNKIEQKDEVQNNRRQFISKFGKLAAVTPIAVTTLMSTYSSKAMASGEGTDDGFDVI